MNKIKIINSAKSWIESNAVMQLEKVSQLKGVVKSVGLPDLHLGSGMPVGSAFLVKERVYPHMIGNDIGCGMALFCLNMKKNKFKPEKAEKKLSSLENFAQLEISSEEILTQLETFEFKKTFGTIGSGNHFAEFQVIDKIFLQDVFNSYELNKNNLYLLVHSGSRAYGKKIFDDCLNVEDFSKGFSFESDEFIEYMKQQNNALKWAKLNRKAIAKKLLTLLNIKSSVSPKIDLHHNFIEEKKIFDEKFFVHRKGAVSGEKGLVVIPGSRGALTYIVEPLNGAENALYSLSHGAGRKWERASCKRKLNKKYTKESIKSTKFKSKVVCNDSNVLFEEAPQAYKNIDQVVLDLVEAGLARVVATLKPVLTFKEG